MTLRVAWPQYGGTFTTTPESQPLRFVLPSEDVDPSPLTILTPAAERTTPRCPHFGICGGCDYQHATYPAQLDLKRTILHDTLISAGLSLPSPIEVHAADPWHYRNRIRLRIEQVEGAFRFCYNRRASRDFLPIVECPIASALLLRAASALVEAAATRPLVADWLLSIAEVEFQTNGNVVQATYFTRDGRTKDFAAFCAALHGSLPELIGCGCLAVTAGYGAKARARWGAGGLAHRVLDRNYWVTRGGFFQVNRFLLPKMVELVTSGRTGVLAWDLYAGVGLFSHVLATAFDEVVAVESAPTSAADLARSAKASKTLRAVASPVSDFLRSALLQRDRPSVIVADPPRAGLGAEVCHLLARIAAPELVYVSCDPTTLARDLAMLVHSGYRIEQVHLLDMFPQTFHLETVVFLKKVAGRRVVRSVDDAVSRTSFPKQPQGDRRRARSRPLGG